MKNVIICDKTDTGVIYAPQINNNIRSKYNDGENEYSAEVKKSGKLSLKRRLYVAIMKGAMLLSTLICVALVLFMVGYVMVKGLPYITWELLSTKPSYLTEKIGILPDILNTVYIVIATLLMVIPLGVGAAIYLTEYASNKKLVGIIEYAAETLSGIPSII